LFISGVKLYHYLMRCLLVICLFLSACSSSVGWKTELFPQFAQYEIQASPFLLTSYERVANKDGTANIYIEGDGRAWLSKSRPSLDPTPRNPLALKLASLDPASNVIYLARPCQYSKMVEQGACSQKYWTSHRFAPEVIEAMDIALEDVKQRHHITKFNLIGYSGGGNIAALLTARRDDVVSLRTVAGNLDHELQSRIHKVSLMSHSLNAKDIASDIAHIPQIHFAGGHDQIVPINLSVSYKAQARPKINCIKNELIPSVSHHKGWEENWTNLLNQKLPDCG